MVIMGLMLSLKLLESNGIKNNILEALPFDVFHKFQSIGMKPNSHGLVWLERGVNKKRMITHVQANRR